MVPPDQLYIVVQLDPTSEELVVLGFGPKEKVEEIKAHAPNEFGYVRYFRSLELTEKFPAWLKKCGLPASEVTEVTRAFGKSLLEIIEGKDEPAAD